MMMNTEEEIICPKVENAFRILGKKWNGLIIHSLLDYPKRFNEITKKLPMLSDRVLACRLKELEEEGIVLRMGSETNQRVVTYELTEKGRELQQAMTCIQHWADKYYSSP